jgi:hypothetical protein
MKTTVEIEWDEPKDANWLCPANIEVALSEYCKNTNFKVTEVKISTDPVTKPMPKYIISYVYEMVDNTYGYGSAEYLGIIEDLDTLRKDLKEAVVIEEGYNTHPSKIVVMSIYKIEG